jgi:endonuclease G, mitochondrial
MAIRIGDLQKAAQRYDSYQDAKKDAASIQTQEERNRLAKIHAEFFTAPSERLAAMQKAAVAGVAPPPLLDAVAIGAEVAFRDNDMRPVRYLQMALLAARSVGKITVRDPVANEEGDATGFLVAPGLLLTNWHVLKTAAHADSSFVTFNFEDDLNGRPKGTRIFDLRPDELFVADVELDYAFVAVAKRNANGNSLTEFGFMRLFEQTGKLDPNQRQAANVIQHPLGQPKKVVVRDNYFEEVPKDSIDPARKQNSLFYGSDTLKGSSGSPVCSDEWYVVALHRGGVPETKVIDGKRVVVTREGVPAREGDAERNVRYLANEGTRVSRLYASLREKAAAGKDDSDDASLALERISAVSTNPKLGPIDINTAPLVLPRVVGNEDAAIQEKLTRRKADLYAGAKGYQANFLGAQFKIDFPELSSEVLREAATLKNSDKIELKYDHFSLIVHAQRRTPIVAACNVNGRQLWQNAHADAKRPTRPQWTLDPRMDDEFQPDDTIFSTAMQRGHLYKREDVWAADTEKWDRADKHSFTITNATPMIGNFNNVEWGDLEDIITRHLEEGNKLTYFAGPIFDIDDRYFNQLKKGVPAADRKKGMRVPSSFWKIAAWVEDGELKAAGFVLHQTDEIKEHGPITEEIDFGDYQQEAISEMEDRTGLKFPDLVAVDTFEG